MAGQKLVNRVSTFDDNLKNSFGETVLGTPFTEIIENGNVDPDDEWALFRLSDDGLVFYYDIGAELAASIMGLQIKDEPAVQEIDRFGTKEKAIEAKRKLSPEEQHRTLIRSVRPKK